MALTFKILILSTLLHSVIASLFVSNKLFLPNLAIGMDDYTIVISSDLLERVVIVPDNKVSEHTTKKISFNSGKKSHAERSITLSDRHGNTNNLPKPKISSKNNKKNVPKQKKKRVNTISKSHKKSSFKKRKTSPSTTPSTSTQFKTTPTTTSSQRHKIVQLLSTTTSTTNVDIKKAVTTTSSFNKTKKIHLTKSQYDKFIKPYKKEHLKNQKDKHTKVININDLEELQTHLKKNSKDNRNDKEKKKNAISKIKHKKKSGLNVAPYWIDTLYPLAVDIKEKKTKLDFKIRYNINLDNFTVKILDKSAENKVNNNLLGLLQKIVNENNFKELAGSLLKSCKKIEYTIFVDKNVVSNQVELFFNDNNIATLMNFAITSALNLASNQKELIPKTIIKYLKSRADKKKVVLDINIPLPELLDIIDKYNTALCDYRKRIPDKDKSNMISE